MKTYFDEISNDIAVGVTKKYSTSFSLATQLLGPSIRQHIYNIYGFVRLADEIVDSFHDYDKQSLIHELESDVHTAIDRKISLNPILNAFQHTVNTFSIDIEYINAFMNSMKSDLEKLEYNDVPSYEAYIYGSADVVGLMCLKVFVGGDQHEFEALKPFAQKLGSAFQKVNFLRDLKDDYQLLGRSYFPNTDFNSLSESEKSSLIDEIKTDFNEAYTGITQLPFDAKLGVYVAYRYYLKLLDKLEKSSVENLTNSRIRVPNSVKLMLLGKSYIYYQLRLV